MHYAYEGEGEYFSESGYERFNVADDGSNAFIPDENSGCFRMIKKTSDEVLGRFYNDLIASF